MTREHTIRAAGKLSKEYRMQFVLTGFTQDLGFRVFAFEGIGEDRTRTKFTVKADLGLTLRYGIRFQELPLLCRALLDSREEGGGIQTLTFTEEQMRACSDERALARDAAAAKKKKSPPRPASGPVGVGWRTPQTS
jgi:hypothetical protein